MDRKFSSLPPDLTPNLPGLSILRFAALLGEGDGELDQDARIRMTSQVAGGALSSVAPSDIWPELSRGLMARVPARMILALRACGALAAVLPEVAALFGVPQIADDPPLVDLGDHLLRALNEAARRNEPLSVRFALLVMNVGKADSPPEHLPVHYRHIDRGGPRIEAICDRFNAPRDCRDLALQSLAECERVHRTSEARAGPVALMLERLRRLRRAELLRASDGGLRLRLLRLRRARGRGLSQGEAAGGGVQGLAGETADGRRGGRGGGQNRARRRDRESVPVGALVGGIGGRGGCPGEADMCFILGLPRYVVRAPRRKLHLRRTDVWGLVEVEMGTV